ncbi:rhodanese domain-containing protein CG4456-like [Chironomus tepperi]|uniref:rhodanese domain-containing protein CG4456-like n=1 Tax=Chironomus tepperi TaxID=113505 RepID=UPI00391F7602
MSSIFKVGIATYEEVIEALRDLDKLIVDVREPEDIQASGSIPKSINIPLNKVYSELRLSAPAFGAKYERTKPGPYDEIIFYCKFGEMAQVAAETALSIGFRNVKNYKNGFSEWTYKWVEWDDWVDPEKAKQHESYKNA